MLIRLQQVAKRFTVGDETVVALGEVDLTIEPGEALAVVGPSGAGKSTLLSLLGLLERPSSGRYELDAIDTGKMDERQRALLRRDRIGFIFQRYNLVEELSVLENVALPLVYRGWSAAERRRAALEALDRVGLAHKARHLPSQLSGGQQQRVAIARALVGGPSILLCDEPTGNLDSQTGAQVLDLLLALHRESAGRVLVVVTHNLEVARRLDRALALRDGHIVADGRPEAVLPA